MSHMQIFHLCGGGVHVRIRWALLILLANLHLQFATLGADFSFVFFRISFVYFIVLETPLNDETLSCVSSEETLKKHTEDRHKVSITEHILTANKNNTEMVLCPHCDYKAITIQSINDHLETDHVELSLFGQVAANQIAATSSFKMFKGELTNILNAN